MEFLDGRWDLDVVGDDDRWCLVECFIFQGTNIYNKYFSTMYPTVNGKLLSRPVSIIVLKSQGDEQQTIA